MNCQNCTHYHDQGSNILCDAGIMEVILIGGPQVMVHMPACKSYDGASTEVETAEKIDKRSKAYRDSHK